MRRILQAFLLSTAIIAIVFYISTLFGELRQKELNIVLISVDTVRPDHLSTYGYDRKTDPNLAKLAESASVFQYAYTLVPQTFPSLAMLLTGKSAASTGIFSNASPLQSEAGGLFQNSKLLDADTETLASILKKNGYRTVSYVTAGILHDDFTGLSRGFDNYNQFEVYDINEWKQKRESYNAFVNNAARWFFDSRQGKFFYWIHLMDPHSPYYPPQDQRCRFQSNNDCQILQSQSFTEVNSFENPYYACSSEEAPSDVVKRYEALYDAEIASSDLQVGKILDALEENKLMDNTLIIYYGDHGESFGHQYYFAHGETLYNSTVRIPVVIYNPLERVKQMVTTQITNVDILPTILDIVHIPYTKKQFDGESFVPNSAATPVSSQNDEYLYFSNYNLSKFAVKKGPYKYILSLPGACLYQEEQEELYDIISDPDEQHNLATMEAEKAAELKMMLQKYISELKIVSPREEHGVNDSILEELKSLGY